MVAGLSIEAEGPAAPPRRNGELVFESPWESRVFGLAIALRDEELLDWEEFREQLITEIAAFERESSEQGPYRYYRLWQRALEVVVDRRGLCDGVALRARSQELAARPHGHDH